MDWVGWVYVCRAMHWHDQWCLLSLPCIASVVGTGMARSFIAHRLTVVGVVIEWARQLGSSMQRVGCRPSTSG